MKSMIGDGEFKAKQTVSKSIVLIVLAAAFILLVPLLAMQLTDEVAWSLGDFVVAGALLVGTGLTYVMSTRKVSNIRYRAVVAVALAVALLLVWVELAVGIVGN
jgi:uncharacterized membrane protein YesL